MKKIIQIIKDNPAYIAMLKGKGDIVVSHASDEAILIASAFLTLPRNMLIVKDSLYQAQILYGQLQELLNNQVLFFPSDESLRVEALAASGEIMGERISTLYELTTDQPKIVICHTHSLIRYVPDKELYLSHVIHLKTGDIIDPLHLRELLYQSGYSSMQRVDEPFYFSKRGGVIDVYSIQYDHPIRIEFFDDEVESIRFYDRNTQRSLEHIDEVTILPATDILYPDNEVNHVIEQIEELQDNTKCEGFEENLEEEISLDIESLKNHDGNNRLYQYMSLFSTSTTLLNYFDKPLIIT
ncbi:MAG: transcription-repair coupling factor, partial [Erysipelotrichaceae bacterium]|nr:transcription-repair coupling factor [Erysipelotrichaceae bacterium]